MHLRPLVERLRNSLTGDLLRNRKDTPVRVVLADRPFYGQQEIRHACQTQNIPWVWQRKAEGGDPWAGREIWVGCAPPPERPDAQEVPTEAVGNLLQTILAGDYLGHLFQFRL